jgi:4-amino-4-deoxy-L-arabinose transferase-like glycosyltransferase
LLGIVLLLLLVAPWLIAVSVHTHGEFLKVAIGQSIGGKLAGTSDRHFGWPGYHTILFMLTFFPGIVLAGLGGIYAFVHRKEPLARFLVCWVVPTWLFFEVVPTKLPHYVLPVFPAVALLAALGLRADSQLPRLTWSRWVHRVAGILFVVASCALAALPIVAARRFGTPLGIPNFVACAAIVAVALAGISLWIKPTGDRLLPLVAAMILTYLSMFGLVIPSLDPLWASDRIAQRLKFLTGCQAVEIATAGFAEPSNLFHFGPSTFLGTGETAAHYLGAHTACGVGIVEASQRAPFDAAATSQGLKFLSFGGVAGYNYVKGRAIKLEILIPAGTRLRVTPKS